MVIVSAKVSKRKILAGVLAAVCVIALLVVLCTKADTPKEPSKESTVQTLDGKTNEDRISYLNSFGWQVQETPSQTQEVRIPEEFDEVFSRYNDMQKAQGFDLSKYAGKAVKRYVYAIENYPGGEAYSATVLVYKNKIIGGDVTGTAQGSQMHGFALPQ